MSLDLVQLRWQQIRVVESSQCVEKENITLRTQLSDLKAKSSKVGNDTLKNFVNKVKNYIIQNKADIGKLKLQFIKEINGLMYQQSELKAGFAKALSIIDDKDTKCMDLKAEIKLLSIQLLEAKQNTSSALKDQEGEMSRLKARVDKLKTEKTELQQRTESMSLEKAALISKCDEVSVARDKAEAKYESLLVECRRLQGVVSKVEEEHAIEMGELQSGVQYMREGYEQRLAELGHDNQYLRTIVAEQEEQIQRLSNALIGNKSHFAKFVEVKTENLTLKAKLDGLAKTNNKYGNALLSGVGGTMSSNTPPPNSDGGNLLLPDYQRLRSKIQITNSNMKIIEGSDGGGNAVRRRSSVTEGQQTTSEQSPRQSVAEIAGGRWQMGAKLTSNSGQSSPRTLSARGQLPNDSNLTVSSVGQQPHPPLGDNTHSLGEGALGPAPNRKSLRRVTTDPSPRDNQQPQQQPVQPTQKGITPIVPGVPLLGKQTRDSLKERLVI